MPHVVDIKVVSYKHFLVGLTNCKRKKKYLIRV